MSTILPEGLSIALAGMPRFSPDWGTRPIPTPTGAGYGVVCGIGLFFSALMLGLTWIQARYTPFSPRNSEGINFTPRALFTQP